jgi:SAM-dependent methyltransferase
LPERVIDYERNHDFWRQATHSARGGLDYIAGQNPSVPERVHLRCRFRQLEFLDRQVLPLRGGAANALDLGCGPGTWALHLAARVRSVLGIDIAPAFVEYAAAEASRRGIDNAEFRLGSFLDFTSEQRFGLVLLGGMLVYVGDRELVPLLQRVRAFLEPGGIVYARSSVAPRRAYARRGRYQAVYRTRADYECAFREAGFRCEAERDLAYTDASLAAVYFAVLRTVSLGRLREAALDRALEWLRPLCYGTARRLLDLTPAPVCYHFVLRAAAD